MSGAQPLPPPLLIHRGRGSRLDEVDEHLHEAPRVVVVREVARLRENLEPAVGNALVGRVRVRHRYQRIVLAQQRCDS